MTTWFCLSSSFITGVLFFCASLLPAESGISTDNVKYGWEENDLGTQITVVNIQSASFGRDASGNLFAYAILYGEPCMMAVIDIASQKVQTILEIPGAKGAYANVASARGDVWFGSNPNGRLYRYKPGSNAIEDMGQPFPETTFIWDMVEGRDEKLYGGTYPQGKVFGYDPNSGKFRGYGSMVEGEDYVRSLAYDPETNTVYVGIGSHAHLVKLDPDTGTKKDILPPGHQKSHFVYALDVSGGKIVAKLDPAYNALVMDTKTYEVEYILPQHNSNHVSPKSPLEDVFYYSTDNKLYEYDMKKRTHSILDFDLKGNARAFALSSDEKGSPLLLALTTGSRILYFDLKTKTRKMEYVDLPKQPVQIQSMIKGPDGNIYTSGYLSGGTAIFDPGTGVSKEFRGVGQAEGIACIGTRLYFGVYPRARFYEFDTAKEWDIAKGNPRQIFTLEKEEQDRPFAMLAKEKENKMFIGTVPSYGILGGALAIFDFATSKTTVHRNIIPDHSITALAYHNGRIYGGTSTSGGLGIKPREEEGKIFIWDVKKGEKTFETAPVPGGPAVTCLKTAPNGEIWGWSLGTLFIFDPEQNKVTFLEKKFPIEYTRGGHVWRGAMMEYGDDGYFYGVYVGKFFRVNIKTRELEILQEKKDINLIARDDAGRFYYANADHLIQVPPPGNKSMSKQ